MHPLQVASVVLVFGVAVAVLVGLALGYVVQTDEDEVRQERKFVVLVAITCGLNVISVLLFFVAHPGWLAVVPGVSTVFPGLGG